MAAAKPDLKAAKEAKQKKLLIVLGVVFLASWPGSFRSSWAATTPSRLLWRLPPQVTRLPPRCADRRCSDGGPCDLAAAAAGTRPKAATSQLASFSLFEAKDPFVQKIVEKTETAKAATGDDPRPQQGAGGGAIAAGGGGATPAVVYGFATIAVNGEAEAVQLKSEFPASDPMFVVGAVAKNQIKIGIAGGKLTNGKMATIKLGKSLTLVNDATGARYAIKLLYTGAEPEATVDFSTTPADDDHDPVSTALLTSRRR